MALRLRRGTNAARTGITPAEGELIYTTDTKKLFAGDGSTVGGNVVSGINDVLDDVTPQLGGDLDLNSNNIVGNGNINITGSVTATNFVGDYKGSIVGDDSTILVDAVASKIILTNNSIKDMGDVSDTGPTANQLLSWSGTAWTPTNSLSALTSITMSGNIAMSTNNITGAGSINATSVSATTVTATTVNATAIDGDITGSVFADNSSLLVDAVNGKIPAANLQGTFTGAVKGTLDGEVTGSVYADDSTLLVDGIAKGIVGEVNNAIVRTNRMVVRTTDATDAELKLDYGSAGAGSSTTLGSIKWADQNTTYGYMSANKQAIFINSNGGGKGLSLFNQHLVTGGVKVKIEPANADFTVPTEALEVLGNIKATGAFMLPVYANDGARDAALTSPSAGMLIFLTAGAKFQGYNGGSWVDLN